MNAGKTTIFVLKKDRDGPVGQVVSTDINDSYVIVEDTPTGVKVLPLAGAILDVDKPVELSEDTLVLVGSKMHWKEMYATTWKRIAAKYPAIG